MPMRKILYKRFKVIIGRNCNSLGSKGRNCQIRLFTLHYQKVAMKGRIFKL